MIKHDKKHSFIEGKREKIEIKIKAIVARPNHDDDGDKDDANENSIASE